MSSFMLKSVAMVTMFIDHMGAVFFPEYEIFRIIGRISFPIFCFLLVEGFYHTGNVYKYLGRLVLIGVISEPIFDKVFYGTWCTFTHNNVFWTLISGLLCMMICNKMSNVIEKYIVFLAVLLLSSYIPMDYGIYGIAMIGGFYFFRNKVVSIIAYQGFVNVLLMGGLQKYGLLGSIMTLLYNGKKGCRKASYAFYILYPLHLWIILLVETVFRLRK